MRLGLHEEGVQLHAGALHAPACFDAPTVALRWVAIGDEQDVLGHIGRAQPPV